MEYKKITVVDENDNVIGYENYHDAVAKGSIRRASVVFIFNEYEEILVQKRSEHISNPLLLDKSCAGHVDEGEEYIDTAKRELKEELGIEKCSLTEVVSSHKRNENFFDTVYTTILPKETQFLIDPHEVHSVQWMSIKQLETLMETEPTTFTSNFITLWTALRDRLIQTL